MMWPKSFDYIRVNSVEEAITQLNKHEDAKLLAGGHSLLPAMKLRLAEPALLVDIAPLGLTQVSDRGHGWSIGAMATHAHIAANANGALAQAAAGIGDQQVRNFGTIGGNIAHADPASDPPAVLVALGAKIYIRGSGGERNVAAEDFFIDLFTTDLLSDEIITSIYIPRKEGHTNAYAKMAHPASRYALVGVAVDICTQEGHCREVRIGVTGATTHAVRASGAEAVLQGAEINDGNIAQACEAIQADIADQLLGDAAYPEDYRQAMAGVFLGRAIRAATA
ncbi:MAG: xanthine dehydrogenase family protein subunit M [Anaerolineaceae bacterium]|nr:xanthine dehydrogenase family protein subunit M [Chloroflexota bacterium]MCY4010232.1 xanthine dehydrogenase family protein subunit M [Anaerolineaceae bacterium]